MKTTVFFRAAKLLTLLSICLAWLGSSAPCVAATGRIYVFTSNPTLEDTTNNFGGFLRSLGYTVTVEQNAGANPYEILDVIGATNAAYQDALIDELTTNYDLIIIHRNYGSGTLASSADEIAIWNNLDVPILCCNAPYIRNNRWKWVDTASSGSLAAPKDLLIMDGAHPIMAGLNTDLFLTNGVSYGGVFGSIDGGTNMILIAEANIAGFLPICLAVWDENGGVTRGFYEGSGQTYKRRRVFFEMQEYRNAGVPGWGAVSWNGNRMWENAVAYAMTGGVVDRTIIGNFSPADGSQYNTAATTFSFQATCPQVIPTTGIQVIVNGQDVSGSLVITGTPTSRNVSYGGLVSNQVYNVSISISNATGTSLAAVQFDTFDATSVLVLSPDFDNVFSGLFTAAAYRVFLQLQSSTPQVVSLSQTNASGNPLGTRLKGVFYVPGSMTGNQLFPLTDALRNQMIIRTPNDTVIFIPDPLSGVTLSALYLVPALDASGIILPALGKAEPYPDQAGVSALSSLNLELIDGDTTIVPGSVQLFLDTANVTSAPQTAITDTPSGANATHTPPSFLAPGTAYTVKVVYSDDATHTITNEYSFSTVQMPALPPSLAAPAGSGVSTGFNLRISMAAGNPDPIFTNTAARAELQLAGILAGPSGPVTNAISGSTSASSYVETNVINYKQLVTDPDQGSLTGDVLFPFGDLVTPSLIAMEATAYLGLPAGVVTFGVASDDGFRLYGGYDKSLVLGTYDGTRGSQVPSEFPVLVYQAGLYPVRLIYYDGGGGASVEFYTANNPLAPSTSGRVPVNGPDESSTVVVPAYRAAPPLLSIQPGAGEIVVSWYGAGNFQLMKSSQLNPASWSPVGQSPVVQGWLHTVQLTPSSSGNEFYRLEMQP